MKVFVTVSILLASPQPATSFGLQRAGKFVTREATRQTLRVVRRQTQAPVHAQAVAASLASAAVITARSSALLAAASFPALAIGLFIGFTLGLLGGGGSIIALPSLIYVFHEPTNTAIAESLIIVCIGSLAGFLSKARSGIDFAVVAPFAVCTMAASFITANAAGTVPEPMRLGLFLAFATVSALNMWASAAAPSTLDYAALSKVPGATSELAAPSFSPAMAVQATGIGILTSLIGAGGGFVIVPALTILGRVPVKQAVTSALLVICLNSATAFYGNMTAHVPIHWALVIPFSAAAAAGAFLGAREADKVDSATVKRLFSGMAFLLCSFVFVTKMAPALAAYFSATY